MAADPLVLKKTYDRMLSDRRMFEPTWQLLGDFVLPRKNNLTRTQSPGQRRTDRLFDSSGVHDAELLRSSLAGALMPPMLKWFSLQMRDETLNTQKPVRDYLEFVRDRVLKALSVHQSNFASEILECLHDLVVFGTGAILEEAAPPGYLGKFGGLRFRALNLSEYVIGEDPFGKVDDLRRKFDMTARQIIARWFIGPDDPKLPEPIKQALDQQKPDAPFEVLHSVYPRADRKPGRGSARNKPWASCYQLYGHGDHLLDVGGFEDMPFLVARWSKSTGEIWGYGPAHTALPDIRSLNRAVELYLAAAGKAVDPTIMVEDDSVLSSYTLEPAGVITRRAGSEKPEVLESKARFDVAEHLNERLERKIAEVFMLEALRLRFKPNMTATEVMALQDEMLRLLGPTAGRVHSELIGPVIERTIGILARGGELPDPPDVLLEQGGDIDIQYEGPLARASKSADLNAIDRVQAMRERIAQSKGDATIYDVFDLDAEIAHYAVNGGYPAPLLREASVTAQLRQAKTAEMQKQTQVDQVEQIAGAAGKAAPALKVLQGGQGQEAAA